MFLAAMAVGAGRASATTEPYGYPTALNREYGQQTAGWHLVASDIPGQSKAAFFDSNGYYTGRWMWGSDYRAMVTRATGAIEGGGVGRSATVTKALAEVGPTQAAKADAIWGKLKTAATGAGTLATLRQLKGEGLSIMARVKAFGALRAIGDVALAATAFEVGYSIGGKIADIFGFGESSEPVSHPEILHYVPEKETIVEPGQNLCELIGKGGTLNIGVCAGGLGTFAAPSALAIVKYNGASQPYEDFQPTVTNCAGAVYHEKVPPGTSPLLFGTETLFCEKSGTKIFTPTWFDVVPLEVTALPGEGTTKPITKTGTVPTPDEAPEAEKKVGECFEGAPSCARLAGWWWNHDPEAKEATKVQEASAGLDPADPLAVQIPVPAAGETYVTYDARLEALGLHPEPQVLAEAAIDPKVGPERVSTTNPRVGSDVEPGTHVKVRYNPATAPETAVEQGVEEEGETSTGGEPWTAPSIPAISLAPLSEIHIGCDTFPFGAFCWYGEALTSWGSEGQCPSFALPVGHATGYDPEGELGTDFCQLEPAMNIIRPVLVLLGTLGIGMFFAYAAMGLGGSGGGED
jgi:hypothetical protein